MKFLKNTLLILITVVALGFGIHLYNSSETISALDKKPNINSKSDEKQIVQNNNTYIDESSYYNKKKEDDSSITEENKTNKESSKEPEKKEDNNTTENQDNNTENSNDTNINITNDESNNKDDNNNSSQITDNNDESNNKKVIEHKAIFYINNKSYLVNCSSEKNSCIVKSPEINVNGYENLGWSTKRNDTSVEYKNNSEIEINKDQIFYAIIRKKLTSKFIVRDNNAVKESSSEKSCYIYNNDTKCSVITPKLTAKQNATATGWSNTLTLPIKGEQEIEINSDTTYYSVTSLKVIVKFDKNTTYNNNVVKKGENGYNFSKENIAAENLSFNETSCYSYNGEGCKINNVPIIYSTGNEIRGFAKSPTGAPTNIYNLVFKSNTTLYARVYNNENRGTLNTYSYGYLGNVPIEMDANLSLQSRNTYMNFLKQLYKDMPELFYTNGKLTLLSQPVYARSVKGSSAGITGGNVPNILINIPTDVVLDKEREATIVHELGHAFGDQYGRKTGHYPENDQNLINIYNKYKNYKTKPLREYSYSHINEFYADAFRFYYEEKYHRGTGIGSATNGYTYRTTTDITNLFNKYTCIAKNSYNENASQCK